MKGYQENQKRIERIEQEREEVQRRRESTRYPAPNAREINWSDIKAQYCHGVKFWNQGHWDTQPVYRWQPWSITSTQTDSAR